MPKREPFLLPERRFKERPPEELWNILSRIYPDKLAALYFEKWMGYAPPQEWRKPETPLHIFSEEEKHGTTD